MPLTIRGTCASVKIPNSAETANLTVKGKQVVGLERGPLSLVSTTEELLVRKVAAPV
jgi:hypothetical protein